MTDINFDGKRVLITGGARSVGSNVAARVCRAGGIVTVLDDLFTGKLENLDPDLKYRFVQGSVTDENLVSKLVKEADYVAHMAARNIIVSTKNPREDYATNIGGTLNVLLAAKEHGRRAGSVHVVGVGVWKPSAHSDHRGRATGDLFAVFGFKACR